MNYGSGVVVYIIYTCILYNILQIQVTNHDGLLTDTGSNFMHTSLHLEDVYSIISKDVAHGTSPLVNDVTGHVSSQFQDPIHIDSGYGSLDNGTSPIHSPKEVNSIVLNDVTPMTSPSEANSSRNRNTPSPQKDSGIDSDNSPSSTADVNMVSQFCYVLKVHCM